jgi:Zn-dependent peptidase ImmA (M78 family)
MSYPTTTADRLIDDLCVKDKADLLRLEEIAWTRGVLVNYEKLEGAEARLVTAKERGVITVSSTVSDSRRKRFSIAHELGHFELHKGRRGLSLCISQDIGGEPRQQPSHEFEEEANEFASALLMPKRFFAPLCENDERSMALISRLANDFSTSLTATALHYLKFCEDQVVVIYSEDNRIKWFRGSASFDTIRDDLGFFIDVRARLDTTTLAAKLFENPNLTFRKHKIDASCWFTPGKYRRDAMVVEDSISMPNYNAVLTLLWVDDSLEEDDVDW